MLLLHSRGSGLHVSGDRSNLAPARRIRATLRSDPQRPGSRSELSSEAPGIPPALRIDPAPVIKWKHSRVILAGNHQPWRSGSWRRLRFIFLRDHRTCAACGRRSGIIAHHVVPFTVDPSRFLDSSNLLPLCDQRFGGGTCHLVIGHCGSFNNWNPDAAADAARALAGDPVRHPAL